MGAKPDEIERQIAQQRARIDQRMQGLESRIRDDVDTVRTEATNRASGTVSGAKELFQPEGPMHDHPLSMMAGALGLGIVLGMVSEGLTADGAGSSSQRHGGYPRETSSSNGSSGIGSMLSGLVGPAAVTAQNEIQDLVKEGFAALKGHSNGRSDVTH
jgi:ElaB/YqjD/DUF883 family membrane-anchored ribosome-binding protein